MRSVIELVLLLLRLYGWCIIAVAVMSWLLAFGVINAHSPFVRSVVDVLYRLTEPLLRPIRRVVPSISGVDFSPVIALIGLWFLGQLIREYAFRMLL